MADAVLYDYWRSSCAYRVRIALNLLGIGYEARVKSLVEGAHLEPDYLKKNVQGLVPTLEIDGQTISQSLAIIEYLNETRPEAGFLPPDPMGRVRVRALSYAIAMEIQPICNLKTANHVVEVTGGDHDTRVAWMEKFVGEGLAAFEGMLASPGTGKFCHGDTPTMADMCLMPQLYNATRFGTDYTRHKQISRIAEECRGLKAFQDAYPDAVNVEG
ncbi:MAG: maleylacetoacetate isomerase [Rhizobiales bacterium]|nr:maleylacetoacetate isomerase [Hyphomicrobiales bacterium]